MATIRLTPSTYAVSNSSYASVTNPNNMYTNTDSTTYASLRNTRNSTSNTYYVYIRGFNFDDVPSDAQVSSFTIKLRGYESYMSTSSSYRMSLYNGTTAISNTTVTSSFSTTNTTFTFPNGSLTWDTLKSYGSNFGIRVPLRRSSTSYNSYIYVYGAEIEVTYTVLPSYTVAALSNVSGVELTPETQSVLQGSSATITIPVDDIDDYVLTDNNIDVTSSVVRHTSTGGSGTVTFIPSSFDYDNSVYNHSEGTDGVYSTNYVNNGLTDHNSSTRCALYSVRSSGTASKMYYNFDCSSIPVNATITSVSCQVKAGSQGSSYYTAYQAYLCSGTTNKTSAVSITGANTSPSTVTISGGTWTRADLDDIKVLFQVIANSETEGSTWSFYGATLSVTYTAPAGYYYTYTINNVQTSHAVLLEESEEIIEPPEEDPIKTYHSLTISSINADTDPENGTTRVEEGTDTTVIITPTEPQLTLALDNGVDVTSQLVPHGITSNTYTITGQVSGASYGFVLNNTTGYYTSNNQGRKQTAAVARVNFDFDVECLVTIEYINYAEANYDYGMFGKIDTTVATDGLSAGSYNSSPSDSTSNYQLAMCSNSSAPQQIIYDVPAGTHFIDIKYGKDDASDDGNDDLRWKIVSVEPVATGSGYYTYTLNDIDQKHSLIFVFGNVNFYFVTSSTSSGARIFPDGQSVALEGDDYKLIIVPDAVSSSIALMDNGNDVTSALTRIDGYDKNNNPIVNYTYRLLNITSAHTLVVSVGGAQIKLYVKESGAWVQYSKAYKKINGSWVEQDISSVFNTNTLYRKGV